MYNGIHINLGGMNPVMYKNNILQQITKVLIDLMLVLGLLICIALPFVMPELEKYINYFQGAVIPATIVLMFSGLCSLFILWQLRAMFKTLLGGNPFVEANVSCLRRCSVASFLISLAFLVAIPFRVTIASIIIIIIFALLGLFSLTLKDVFKQAVAYKVENDWTV